MIKEFQREYRFLSNFWPCSIIGYGKTTVEHCYQASKCKDTTDFNAILAASTPGEAKKLSRKVVMREHFELEKKNIMLQLLRSKFSDLNPELKEKLLATGNEELQEGNYWGDTFWGVDLRTGKGNNLLGKLLMQVRAECKSQTP